MSVQLNKKSYESLINGDIEWLTNNTEDTIERRHIIETLKWTINELYNDSRRSKNHN